MSDQKPSENLQRFLGNRWARKRQACPGQELGAKINNLIDLGKPQSFHKTPYKKLEKFDGRSPEEMPWLYSAPPFRSFIPDPYLNGDNWTQNEIPHYIGPITAETERDCVQYIDPELEAPTTAATHYEHSSLPQPDRSELASQRLNGFQQPSQQQVFGPQEYGKQSFQHQPSESPRSASFHTLQGKNTVQTPTKMSNREVKPHLYVVFDGVNDEMLENELLIRMLPLGGSRDDKVDRIVAYEAKYGRIYEPF